MLDRELIRHTLIFDTQIKPYIFTLCVIVKTLIFFSHVHFVLPTSFIIKSTACLISCFCFFFFLLFFYKSPIKNRFLYKNVFILLYLLQVQQHIMRGDIDEGANDNRSEDELFK